MWLLQYANPSLLPRKMEGGESGYNKMKTLGRLHSMIIGGTNSQQKNYGINYTTQNICTSLNTGPFKTFFNKTRIFKHTVTNYKKLLHQNRRPKNSHACVPISHQLMYSGPTLIICISPNKSHFFTTRVSAP
jgi:hypothetical protein